MENQKLQQLVEDAQRSSLVLFVGSSVMASTSPEERWLVPRWSDLVNSLLRSAIAHLDDPVVRQREGVSQDAIDNILQVGGGSRAAFNVYEQAALARRLLGPAYLWELRSRLYEQYYQVKDNDWLQGYPFLGSVVNLCRCDAVAAVITYNYDDLLEDRVAAQGGVLPPRPTISVAGPEDLRAVQARGGPLPVYHVHGLLPHRGRDPNPQRSAVVFGLTEYFDNMLGPHLWHTSTQLHFLRTAACLFVGCSLSDINMLRMLHYATRGTRSRNGPTVYALMATKEAYDGKPDDKDHIRARLRATVLDEVGVEMIAVNNFGRLPVALNGLRQSLRTKPWCAQEGNSIATDDRC